MTIANKIGKLLPEHLYNFLQPKYHFLRAKKMLLNRGGSYYFNKNYGGWILQLPMPNKKKMIVIARSPKEFKRLAKFGNNSYDLVWKWINWIDKNNVVYDIGSANGLEGFSCSHLRSSSVYFIEPYTPSIETILKTIFIIKEQSKEEKNFEVVHAGCSNKEDYKRLYMHQAPLAGETKNTYGNRNDYDERAGRSRKEVYASQWVKGITIDSLKRKYKLKPPDYIKIDVDGHEDFVIQGAIKTLKKKCVKSWSIEITGDKRIQYITKIMKQHGYIVADDFNHYPGVSPKTIDRIFIKKKYLNSWKSFKINNND